MFSADGFEHAAPSLNALGGSAVVPAQALSTGLDVSIGVDLLAETSTSASVSSMSVTERRFASLTLSSTAQQQQ